MSFTEGRSFYLSRNEYRLRSRVCAIPYRAKVLGRALLSARTNANSFWMLLSGNAEVAFPSTTADIPTPAIAAAASNTAGRLDNVDRFAMLPTVFAGRPIYFSTYF
jgi:hypothetical protein